MCGAGTWEIQEFAFFNSKLYFWFKSSINLAQQLRWPCYFGSLYHVGPVAREMMILSPRSFGA